MIDVVSISKEFKRAETKKKLIMRKASDAVFKAVDNVSFQCKPGRVFTLLGPNGAGKTTALRMLAGMLNPTRGSVSIAGHNIAEDPQAAKSKLGFLTGATGLYDRLNPRETLKYFAELNGVPKSKISGRVDELIDKLEIGEFADRRCGKLSMGQKQRVSIARALIHDPEVIIFDEPTNGLDVLTSRTIIKWIRECKSAGKTVVFSTHIMGEVSLLSDDLAVMHNGKLCYCNTFEQFKQDYGDISLEDAFIQILEEAQ